MTSLYRTSTRPLPYVEGGHTRTPQVPEQDDVTTAAQLVKPRVGYINRFDAYERILGLSAEVHRLEPFEARYKSLLGGIKSLHEAMTTDTDTPAEEWHSDVLNTLGGWITGEQVNADLRPTAVNQILLFYVKDLIAVIEKNTIPTPDKPHTDAGRAAAAKKFAESL